MSSDILQTAGRSIAVGDRILQINDDDVSHWRFEEVIKLLSATPHHSAVRLLLDRHAVKQKKPLLVSPEEFSELQETGNNVLIRGNSLIRGSVSFSSPLDDMDEDMLDSL